MKKEEMNKTVLDDLEHIPKGSRGSLQNFYRSSFNAARRHDLARSKPKGFQGVIDELNEFYGKRYPRFMPEFRGV